MLVCSGMLLINVGMETTTFFVENIFLAIQNRDSICSSNISL